jgi:hypothetical protein
MDDQEQFHDDGDSKSVSEVVDLMERFASDDAIGADSKDGDSDRQPSADTGADPDADDAVDGDRAADTKEPEKESDDQDDSTDDEDRVEIPVEDGDPIVVSLSELVEAYQSRDAKPVPGELAKQADDRFVSERAQIQVREKELSEARDRFLKLAGEMSSLDALPQKPSADLIDPDHPSYDPDKYNRLLAAHERAEAQVSDLRDARAKALKEQEAEAARQQNEILDREAAVLKRAWPEFSDTKVQTSFVEDLGKFYGITPDIIGGVADHRFFLIAKDALAHRVSQETAKSVARKVRAKPRLVKSAARPSQQHVESQKAQAARERAAKTGSEDDVLAAMRAAGFE